MSSADAALNAARTLYSAPDTALLEASRRAEAVGCPSSGILRSEVRHRGTAVGGVPVDLQMVLLASALVSFREETLRRVSDSIRAARRDETSERARWMDVAAVVEKAWALRIHHGPPLPLISRPENRPLPSRTARSSSRPAPY